MRRGCRSSGRCRGARSWQNVARTGRIWSVVGQVDLLGFVAAPGKAGTVGDAFGMRSRFRWHGFSDAAGESGLRAQIRAASPLRGHHRRASPPRSFAETADAACPSRIGLRPSGQGHPPLSIVRGPVTWVRRASLPGKRRPPSRGKTCAPRGYPGGTDGSSGGGCHEPRRVHCWPVLCGWKRGYIGRADGGSVLAVGLFARKEPGGFTGPICPAEREDGAFRAAYQDNFSIKSTIYRTK